MEIHYGSFRAAILIGPLVIKIPNMQKILYKCRNFKTVRDLVFAAMQQNWSEYKCWLANKAGYLATVYFSLGLFSIVRRNYGVEPDKEEWAATLKSLPEDAYQYLFGVDFHSYHRHNIRRTSCGYQFIDYGATAGDDGGHIITEFLTRWKPDLERILLK
ncbi:MAG: hypothetical protein Q7S19_00145 [bacterium]|nr:hypothetical protein [bacterium]